MGPVNVIQKAIEKLEAAENGQKKKICSIVSAMPPLVAMHNSIYHFSHTEQKKRPVRKLVWSCLAITCIVRVFFGKIAEKEANEKITSQGYCIWLGMVWLRLIPKICIVFSSLLSKMNAIRM